MSNTVWLAGSFGFIFSLTQVRIYGREGGGGEGGGGGGGGGGGEEDVRILYSFLIMYIHCIIL